MRSALAAVPPLAALFALVACGSSQERSARRNDGAPSIPEITSPAGPGSGEPFLSSDSKGRVIMSWLEPAGDSSVALKFSRLDGEVWSSPATVSVRPDFVVNWADFPSVVVTSSGRLVAHWLQKSGSGKYTYDTRFSTSADDGRTWSPGTLLNRDGVAAEHGFVTLMPTSGDAVQAIWLDGRASASADTARRAMKLLTASIAPDGSLGAEGILDERTCDCCQTAATIATSGPVVAYRDRSPEEVRDIAVVRMVDGRWTLPSIVHADGWRIDACPVNGPAIASRGDTVVVAWFTGAKDTARVQVVYSMDGGATFGPPSRIDGGNPAGRVDVELLDRGAVVSWLERTDSTTAEVRARRAFADRAPGKAITIARSSGARASGFPRIVHRGDDLIAAWTQPGDSARVRVARLALRDLP